MTSIDDTSGVSSDDKKASVVITNSDSVSPVNKPVVTRNSNGNMAWTGTKSLVPVGTSDGYIVGILLGDVAGTLDG